MTSEVELTVQIQCNDVVDSTVLSVKKFLEVMFATIFVIKPYAFMFIF